MPGFKELGVSELLNGLLQGQGIAKPTPVQEEAIPPLVQGLDVIARAKTGTGKTLAFLLPIMDKIRVEQAYPQALIMAPTRELALQITEEARKLARHTGVKILAVYGGQDVEKQLRKLEGGRHLIIGTPGRLLDHIRRGTLDLGGVKMLVLDEADQMLHMGFLEDVETIITAVPYRRQTMLFSATMPDPIKRLASKYMKEPLDIVIKSGSPIPLENIRQQVVECSDRNKEEALIALIERDRPYLAMIFCRTKRRVSKLNEALQAAGYDCDELHGDLSQSKREAVMKRFREAKLQLLVATDVAARGLDVEGITHVFNYDLPLDADSYIHRIGRTGRAGGKGLAITFASPRERAGLELIEHGISQRLDRRRYEKDEFGVGEFISVQGGRQNAVPEGARNGRGGRAQGRSGGAPRAEAGARPGAGGRGRGKEAGGWGAPAEGRSRSAAAGGKRSGWGDAAPRGGGHAGKSAAKPRTGGGYGSYDARSSSPAAGYAAGESAAGQRGGKGAAGSKGGPGSGYSANVSRGAEAGGFSYGASKGAGSGSGYNPGGAQASPKHRANVARSNDAGGWSSSAPAKGGGARSGSKGGKGGYGPGGRSSGGKASSRGGRGNGSGGTRGGRGSSR
ncbi:DEAD/DEAH box helicase [Paenibacillus riograndensis]|uniref:RNA helicase n=2 Tax=Paenibacillus riograndensis TaxID=483937 RepID=A0A0E4CZN5_9BACL|nr:DEAD/DEAH box helicase [Paenibacillus riograndensis]CQR58732.1 DEAD/DEAH box helicase domain protein [Paenibacillus riograndensis SBR5]